MPPLLRGLLVMSLLAPGPGDPVILVDFPESTRSLGWNVVNDSVMGGRSEGDLRLEGRSLVFTGRTNTDGGGFSSVRSGAGRFDLGAFDGIRLRVRPYRSRRAKPGEQEFVLQVTNETGEPVIFWEIGALSDRCEVRVDGKPASVRERRAGVFGWSAPRTCEKPMEMRFQLPGDQGLPPGRHTITVGLRGVGGTHRNASGAPVPILLGEVWTDETHFLIP